MQSLIRQSDAHFDGKRDKFQNSASGHGAQLPDIAKQILAAFKKGPDQAGIFHGVRRVKRGARGRRTSLFASAKSGGSFILESGPELAYALTLERNPFVVSFRTQALQVEVPGHGFAYPDFVVRFESHFEVHEVKASKNSLSKRQIQRYEALKEEFARQCVCYKMVDGKELPQGAGFERLCIEYTRGHVFPINDVLASAAKELLVSRKIENLLDAYNIVSEHGFPVTLVDYLKFHGHIEFGVLVAREGRGN